MLLFYITFSVINELNSDDVIKRLDITFNTLPVNLDVKSSLQRWAGPLCTGDGHVRDPLCKVLTVCQITGDFLKREREQGHRHLETNTQRSFASVHSVAL